MAVLELAACPVCETKQFRQLADATEVRQQLEKSWLFHMRRLKPGAPLETLFDRTIFSQDPPLHLVECSACGTVMRNPRESPEQIVRIYENETAPVATFQALFAGHVRFFQPRIKALERLLGRKGTLLEVGSYVGAFLHCAMRNGWHAEGIDVNETANQFARAHGCVVHTSELEAYSADREFDVVAIWNCLDQLPNPRAAIARARHLLRPDGILVARIPNGAFYVLSRRIPLPNAVPAYNNMLGFPYRHGFTPASLRALLRNVGLKVVRTRGDTLAALGDQWTRRWAVAERLATRSLTHLLLPRTHMPWLEVYARTIDNDMVQS